MALALLLPPKAKAANVDIDIDNDDDVMENPLPTSPPELTGRWDFGRLLNVEAHPDIVAKAAESAKTVQALAETAVQLTANAAQESEVASSAVQATGDTFAAPPMNYEQIRLWLQCYNAGPYATLKYKGEVPYKETRNYVPRVLKYYDQDLSSEYDPLIEKAAAKYGLEPQLIRAVMKTESSFRNDTVSHAGARGLLQVMPVVWKDISKKYNLDWNYHTEVFEPEKNIEVACAYLAWLRYDFLPRHFAAYEKHPDAPSILVRDVDRGVPDRKSPRIIAKSDTSTPRTGAVEVASADVRGLTGGDADAKEEDKAVAQSSSKSESKQDDSAKAENNPSSQKVVKNDKATESKPASDKAEKSQQSNAASGSEKRSRVQVTDAQSSDRAKSGQARTSKNGSGKAISITLGRNGKITTKKGSSEGATGKKASIARASSRDKTTEQGG